MDMKSMLKGGGGNNIHTHIYIVLSFILKITGIFFMAARDANECLVGRKTHSIVT